MLPRVARAALLRHAAPRHARTRQATRAWLNTSLAVRCCHAGAGLKMDAEVQRTLHKEVDLMRKMRHPNIILFMGVVPEPAAVVTGERRGADSWAGL